MDRLWAAVAPFTPEMVARRAGIDANDLIAAAELFAHRSKRGGVGTGTGVDMARFPNLAELAFNSLLGSLLGRRRCGGAGGQGRQQLVHLVR